MCALATHNDRRPLRRVRPWSARASQAAAALQPDIMISAASGRPAPLSRGGEIVNAVPHFRYRQSRIAGCPPHFDVVDWTERGNNNRRGHAVNRRALRHNCHWQQQ
jgi:hypothetical protein